MGEYVKVICEDCKQELGEVWIEEIDKPLSVAIASPTCECIDQLYKDEWDAGYETGFEEGKEKDE